MSIMYLLRYIRTQNVNAARQDATRSAASRAGRQRFWGTFGRFVRLKMESGGLGRGWVGSISEI
eukprot:624530-Amorphochlora_amoeboformis.AAC.1